jgi:DNA-binding transcriptional LysR family regulator
MSMLDLRRLTLLCDLADLGSVSAVAQRRNITSSAVSQQLRILETEAGATLFRREGRTLGLTRSGLVLVEYVRVVMGAMDDAMSALAASGENASGRVALVSYNLGIPTFAAPLVQQLSRLDPGLQILIQQADPAEALRLVRRGDVDVAISYRCNFEAQDVMAGLNAQELLIEPMVLLAPPEAHSRIRRQGLAALAEQSWVTGLAGSILDVALSRAADRADFAPRVTHRLETAQIVCDMAATELVATIVPRLSVPAHLAHLVLEEVPVGHRTISAVVRPGRRRDPHVALVLRTLQGIGATALATVEEHLVAS